MTSGFKKTKLKLELLTDIGIILMVEKGIRGGICHGIHRYTKANRKYIKDYDKNKESLYLKYWGVNNLYGWAMSRKLPVNKLELVEDTSKILNDLPILPERMKLGKIGKLVTNLFDKNGHIIHISNLKQAINHGLISSYSNYI